MSKRFVNPALLGPLCLVLLIWQLSASAYTQARSQATPGPGKVVVRGPRESPAPGRPDLPQKRVLILYSEDKAHPAHELTDRGIRAVFQSNKLFDVQLYTEYLDLSRFRGPGHARAMADYLNRKYADTKIDVIITVFGSLLFCSLRLNSIVKHFVLQPISTREFILFQVMAPWPILPPEQFA